MNSCTKYATLSFGQVAAMQPQSWGGIEPRTPHLYNQCSATELYDNWTITSPHNTLYVLHRYVALKCLSRTPGSPQKHLNFQHEQVF